MDFGLVLRRPIESTLLYKQGEVFQIKVIKIKIPVEKPIPQIEDYLRHSLIVFFLDTYNSR